MLAFRDAILVFRGECSDAGNAALNLRPNMNAWASLFYNDSLLPDISHHCVALDYVWMDFVGIMYGLCMDSVWSMHGLCMDDA